MTRQIYKKAFQTLRKDDTRIKNTRKLFRLNKENETIEDRITEDIRKKFEHEEED